MLAHRWWEAGMDIGPCSSGECAKVAHVVQQTCRQQGLPRGAKVMVLLSKGPCTCDCPDTGRGLSRLWRRAVSLVTRPSREVRAERLAACAACPHVRAGGALCGLCGCAVRLKTMVGAGACPAGRWQAA
ncbi:hypothetical protein [Caulobacter mirabilis]|nr:hypothetical protein [Caulobacter mirabilis]